MIKSTLQSAPTPTELNPPTPTELRLCKILTQTQTQKPLRMGEGEWVMVNRVRNFGDGNEASEMRKKMEKLRNREGRERKDRAECVDEREVSGGKHNKFFFFFF